jgi:hypothetical integral membrane protein (TIGR02206 family)
MMEKYFGSDFDKPFMLFSTVHIFTLAVLILIITLLYYFRDFFRKPFANRFFRYSFALLLLLSEISLTYWLHYVDVWTITASLPLHISSISLFLSIILLLTRSYKLFEITYFVGVGSALQAMVTPDISAYSFPHFRYIHFFISHGGIVVANFFVIFIEGFKPTYFSIWRAFLYLNGYMFLMFIFNFMINGNYLYISKKPVNPSIIDYLGPWPWYILPLEVIALTTFIILYLPFFYQKRKKSKLHR